MDCCTGAAPGAVRTAPFVPFSRAMTTYARRLGLFSGTMAVIGGIIGGGVFRTPATVAGRGGAPPPRPPPGGGGGGGALVGAVCLRRPGPNRPQGGRGRG